MHCTVLDMHPSDLADSTLGIEFVQGGWLRQQPGELTLPSWLQKEDGTPIGTVRSIISDCCAKIPNGVSWLQGASALACACAVGITEQ